eukprot:CAMPEP_0179177970 /NCGR_PEP_ID=MMETSP0796-20121207/88026_1 /TAXON_ID=73915 /ORGANISM="Pyrodinium bahamense, Strain pbaha01" /LENGTH=71 /DNA_ID=CAMNT_0020881541 /DNA_START=28 /DNA_END=240 /DNA_ORIENTATION=-
MHEKPTSLGAGDAAQSLLEQKASRKLLHALICCFHCAVPILRVEAPPVRPLPEQNRPVAPPRLRAPPLRQS